MKNLYKLCGSKDDNISINAITIVAPAINDQATNLSNPLISI